MRISVPSAMSSIHIRVCAPVVWALNSPSWIEPKVGATQVALPPLTQPSPGPLTSRISLPSTQYEMALLLPSKVHSQHIHLLRGTAGRPAGTDQQSWPPV